MHYRTTPQKAFNFSELVVDNFAGGGGASTGIEAAIGSSVDIAINHDTDAIAMHTVNHPTTRHYCESVWDIDPRKVTNGQPVGLAWFSPDCKHFSKAKGGTPVKKEIRGLAWVVLRWIGTVRPRVIMLENVEEFLTWGPLVKDDQGNMRPCPKRKGQTFRSFVNAIKRHGYQVEWKQLRACDYGAPTIRKRLFLIARCDGQPIVWPAPTHGDPSAPGFKESGLKKWRTAADIIDWSLPCPSIFERKRPLAENTLRRIARGIQRFVIENPKPFIVKANHGYDYFRGQSLSEPLQTVTSQNGYALVEPHIVRIGQQGFGGDGMQYSKDQPLTTITTKAEHCLIAPIITRQFGKSIGHTTDEPSATITAGGGGKSQLVAAFLAKHYGGNYTGPGANLDDPTPTVTGIDHNALVAANLIKYYGPKSVTEVRGHLPSEPIHTLTTENRYALATSHLVKLRGTNIGCKTDTPTPTITAGGNHIGEVRAFLTKFYGPNIGTSIDEPVHTITTKDRFGLVTVKGEQYQIIDIGMRMLEPHELFAAQGFPANYVIHLDVDGNPAPKYKQVARCGNSVCPPLAEALVKANYSEAAATEATETEAA